MNEILLGSPQLSIDGVDWGFPLYGFDITRKTNFITISPNNLPDLRIPTTTETEISFAVPLDRAIPYNGETAQVLIRLPANTAGLYEEINYTGELSVDQKRTGENWPSTMVYYRLKVLTEPEVHRTIVTLASEKIDELFI